MRGYPAALTLSAPVNVCIDIQSAVTQRAGVGRYTRVLTEHMARMAGDDQLQLFYFDFARKGHAFTCPQATIKAIRWCPGRIAQRAWRTLQWPPFDALAGPADVYHFPNFTLPPLRRGKSVVTIHDMSFFRFPEFAEPKNLRNLEATIHHTARHADAIITDSTFSANEVSELLKVDASRVVPIHLGIAKNFVRPDANAIAATRATLGLDRPYLLTVGTLEPRKNIPFLISLMESLKGFDGTLVIAGMPGWKCEPIIERMTTSSCAPHIRWLRYVEDHHLPGLYAGAELFLCSSFYEGFGFPPLEAMACGTPVVSSSGGSLKEVLGTAAAVHDTFELDAWKCTVEALLESPSRRTEHATAGKHHAARYTWEATARKTWEVYRSLEKGNG